MTKKAIYEKLVFATYIFYTLLAALWFLIEVYENKSISSIGYIMLVSIGTFSLQAYYKLRVANLILGLIILAISIFGVPFFLSWGVNSKDGFDTFIYVALSLCVTSIACSILLVFSYLKLSFSDD